MRLLGHWASLMSFSSNSGMISDVRSVMRWLGEFGRSLMFAHFTTTPFGRISKRAPQQTFLMKMNRTWIYDVYDLQILRAHMLKTSSWCCSFRGTAGWLGPVTSQTLVCATPQVLWRFCHVAGKRQQFLWGVIDLIDPVVSNLGTNCDFLLVFCNWDPMQEQSFCVQMSSAPE